MSPDGCARATLCDHVGTITVASYSGAVSNMIET